MNAFPHRNPRRQTDIPISYPLHNSYLEQLRFRMHFKRLLLRDLGSEWILSPSPTANEILFPFPEIMVLRFHKNRPHDGSCSCPRLRTHDCNRNSQMTGHKPVSAQVTCPAGYVKALLFIPSSGKRSLPRATAVGSGDTA